MVVLGDENGSWWVGKVLQIVGDQMKVWEYGSSSLQNVEAGTIPPRKTEWHPRYQRGKNSVKAKDLFTDCLSFTEKLQGFKKVIGMYYVESALVWGRVLAFNATVQESFWRRLQEIVERAAWD